jgi:hypothetical protein
MAAKIAFFRRGARLYHDFLERDSALLRREGQKEPNRPIILLYFGVFNPLRLIQPAIKLLKVSA